MQLDSINPKNNQLINSWDIHNVDEVNAILEKANIAYLEWKNTQLSFRINCLKNISELLKDRSNYSIIEVEESESIKSYFKTTVSKIAVNA